MLKYRILSALVMIPAALAGLFLLSPVAFSWVLIVICMLAAWEWGQFAGMMKQVQRVALALVTGLILFVLYDYAHRSMLKPELFLIDTEVVQIALLMALGWWLAAIGLVLTYPKSAMIWHRSVLSRLFFGALTIIPFFLGMIALYQFGNEYSLAMGRNMGAWSLLYVMVLVWGADSGAYAFGRLFGKHKLAPSVSPGKTWEGVMGGLLTSVIISLIFNYYINIHTFIPYTTLMICSVVAVVASIFGDLTESMFKREAGIKDSSHLIPGHGGILDRIDSLTAAIPVFIGLLLVLR